MRAILVVAALFALCLQTLPVAAQVQPADSAVKAALYDINRYEKQAATLTPARKGHIKRALKMLKLTEGRLAKSPNKSHPSWVDADKRLKKLQSYLANMLAGGAPAPARAAKPVPQKRQRVGVSNALKPILSDLDRYEKASSGLSPARKSRVQQTLRLLSGTEARLNQIPNKNDPAWVAANKRLQTLKNYLAGMLGPKPPAPGGAPSAPAKTQQAKPAAPAAPAGGGIPAFEKKLIGNLDLETRQLWAQLKKTSVLSFQQRMNVQHWRNKIKNLNGRFGRLPNKNRPEAKQVAKQIAFLNKTVEGAIAKASQLQAQTGNAPARFAQIRRKYNSLPRLEVSSQLTKAKIQKYLDQVKAVKASTQKDLAYVKSVQGKTIAVSPRDIKNMEAYLTRSVPGRLQRDSEISIKQLEEKISVSQQQIDIIKKTDPNNAHHARNRLTGKGHLTRAVKRLDEGIALVKTAQTLEAGIGRKGGPDRAAQIKGFEAAKVMLNEKFKVAIGHVRMPKAKSNDAKLVQIVKQVLGSGRYKKVYPHVRVVLNTTKRKNAKETAYRSGRTVTFYKYVWEEFQAATAEKLGEDEYYIYYNTLRFYHKADPKTPTGKWIIGKRFQGSRILKENIQK